MRKPSHPCLLCAIIAAGILSACSPTFNWRDYRNADAGYRVLFPDKPATYTRHIELDGINMNMTMVAAEVDHVTFAVGSGAMPDAATAQAAVAAMPKALVNNIGGTVKSQGVSSAASVADGAAKRRLPLEMEAAGMQQDVPVLLVGRFVARDKWIYQIIVMGKEKQFSRENAHTFIDSFKLD